MIESQVPKSEPEWAQFNISLEEIMKKALEDNSIINIGIAEIVLEKK